MKSLIAALGTLLFASCDMAAAAETYAAVPRAVIYPRDVITEEMLVDVRLTADGRETGHIVQRRMLVGKVARTTLLPGRLIARSAIEEPRIVALGSQVQIVFRSGQITISVVGTALQSGSVGDVIRVRNQDSGLTVSGQIQPDGVVLLGGS